MHQLTQYYPQGNS